MREKISYVEESKTLRLLHLAGLYPGVKVHQENYFLYIHTINVNKNHFQIKTINEKKRHLKLWMSKATDCSRLDPLAHKTSVKHIYFVSIP